MLNSHYDDDPAAYAAKRQGWLNRRRRQRAVDFLATAQPGQRVVDLGAGTGDLTLTIAAARPDLKVVGVEPLESYVAFAAERAAEQRLGNVEFVQGFAEQLDSVVEPGSVDRLVSSDVMHHVTDEVLAIESVTRVSAPGARWLAIEPNCWNVYIFLFQALTAGERNFRPARFRRRATAAGWTVARTEYLFLIPSAIAEPKPWMKRIEERGERWRPLGGGIATELVRP